MPRTYPLLTRSRLEGAPLIADHTVTFVWEGRTAPLLLGDFTDWHNGPPLTPVCQAPGVWTYTLNLPQDAYIEYAYFSDVAKDQRLVDPLNPRKITNGFGKYNQYFYMPGRSPTPLTRRQRGTLPGRITSAALPTQ